LRILIFKQFFECLAEKYITSTLKFQGLDPQYRYPIQNAT
jgi:hypothetical protein